jgi:hypothetical protein
MALEARSKTLEEKGNVLEDATVYLSGPMDFVASREEEKKNGWRNRIGQFLRKYGVTVYDPWNKPQVTGMPHYGKEDEFSNQKRERWTFADSAEADRTRAELCSEFWPTLHIDLRMTDTADFLIAYVPTNVYSVGTVHEIVMARLQYKPVLFVSPPIVFQAHDALAEHLKGRGDARGQEMLRLLATEAPLRPNPRGIPSMWYMALVDGHYFFDGFGFAEFRDEFGWQRGALDAREEEFPPQRPLLRYLANLDARLPKRYDLEREAYVENPDWLIFEDEDL